MIPWKKKRTDKEEDVTLADIIRGLQYCVNSSREITMRHEMANFNEFIDSDNNPYYRTVNINEKAAIDVPLLCMYNHETLGLDEMEVSLELVVKNMALKVPETVVKETDPEINDRSDRADRADVRRKTRMRSMDFVRENIEAPEGLSRTSFSVDLDSARTEGKNTRLGLKLTFKADSPPEAISRVVEKLNGQIMAYSLEHNDTD